MPDITDPVPPAWWTKLPKKITLAFASLILLYLRPYLAKVGVEITAMEMLETLGVIATLIAGIGLADHGKEAAKKNAEAAVKVAEIHAAARAADPPASTQVTNLALVPPPLPPAETPGAA